MASVGSCVSVKSATVSPVRYRSTRPGAAGSGNLRAVRSASLALGGDGGCCASTSSSSGRGVVAVSGGGLGLLGGGDGPRIIRRGGREREVLAMCSASFDGVRPATAAGASVASAVQPVPAFPERAKVVALVAAIMLLCNADRVVMSVAVVPLAAQHGWSSSFVGIVQVEHLAFSPLSLFRLWG